MDLDDPFPRELRSARDRIAELQRRSATAARRWRPSACATRSCSSRRPSPTWSPTMARIAWGQPGGGGAARGWASGSWPASRWPPMSRAATWSSARWSTGCAWATRARVATGRCGSGGAAASAHPRRHRGADPGPRRRAGDPALAAAPAGAGGGGRPGPPGRARRRPGRRRRRDLEALEDLDVAADLDGTVQVLLDAGVRLLGVDGIGLMLADGQGRLCAAGGSDDAVVAFLRAQEHVVKGPCVPTLPGSGRPGPLPGRRRALAPAGRGGRRPRRGRGPGLDRAVRGAGRGLPAGVGPAAGLDRHRALAAEAFASVLAAMLELAAEAQRGSGLSRQLGRSRARRWWSRPRAP